MPSPHRRIGLVVDEPVDGILGLFREGMESVTPEAKLARMAVLEGALVEALVKAAGSDRPERERAAELVALAKELVPDLPLSGQVKDELLVALSRAAARPAPSERRRRQLALLRAAGRPSDGQTAQDLAETFDAFERLPVR
jgi:hypothetical protein